METETPQKQISVQPAQPEKPRPQVPPPPFREFQVSDPFSPLDGLGCCPAECDQNIEGEIAPTAPQNAQFV